MMALANVCYLGGQVLAVRVIVSGNLWVLTIVSSAFVDMSHKKNQKLYHSECVVFVAGLVSYHFIYLLCYLLAACFSRQGLTV